MKRQLSENQPRPTAGCLSVPLFNQKKRSRLPLTSNPSENEFCPSNEYSPAQSFASSFPSGSCGNSKGSSPSYSIPAGQRSEWNRQGCPISRSVAQSTGRSYAPLPHPCKTGNMGSQIGQQRSSSWHSSSAQPNAKQSSSPNSRANVQDKSKPYYNYMQTGHQPSYRQPSSPEAFRQQQPKRPNTTPAHPPVSGVQWQNSDWQLKPHTSQFKEDSPKVFPTRTASHSQKSAVFQVKPAVGNSLRILTAVIEGMKHWSQYRDRAPFLFEVFGTLDSAVTVGSHGAKNFLLRDRTDVVQCVFYETDRNLPRLTRSQVHRCMGNYHPERNLFTCVSVRPASSSEQRNSQESVRASDAEMRRLVRSFSEM